MIDGSTSIVRYVRFPENSILIFDICFWSLVGVSSIVDKARCSITKFVMERFAWDPNIVFCLLCIVSAISYLFLVSVTTCDWKGYTSLLYSTFWNAFSTQWIKNINTTWIIQSRFWRYDKTGSTVLIYSLIKELSTYKINIFLGNSNWKYCYLL